MRPDAIPETDTVPVVVNGRLTLPLPMFWGTMPRFLARFSRDLELLPFEQRSRGSRASRPAARG